jgi:nucleoside-diphosphate-sugar epimerase
VRDFTYVGDIVRALTLAVEADQELPGVMNLSGGASVSVNEVIETIEGITGRAPRVERGSAVAGDVYRTGGDSSRARTSLGWVPQVGLEEGLRRQWEWVLETGTVTPPTR